MKIECSGSCGRTLDIRTVRILNWNTNEAVEVTEEAVHILSEPKYLCKRCHDKMVTNGMMSGSIVNCRHGKNEIEKEHMINDINQFKRNLSQ